MSITQQFLSRVEGYLVETGMDPTNFGIAAMNDPAFVGRLRRGRSPSGRTMDRVLKWMAENPPQQADKRAAG